MNAHSRILASALALAALSLAGCDNPACVFGGGCFSGPGGALGGANPAFRPSNHQWLDPGPPGVIGFFPTTGDIHSETPVVVLFRESMAAQTVTVNVTLFDLESQFGEAPVPILPPALVGDGRMLVVIPALPLQNDHDHELRWNDKALVTDLTGTGLTLPADLVIGAFTTAATDPTVPRVVATWPRDNSTAESTTGEIAVVFDRPVTPATVTSQSFVVTAGSATPAFNPPAQQVILIGPTGVTTDSRVWQYRSVDGKGEAVSLGTSTAINLTLSPASDPITSLEGAALPQYELDYVTAAFEAPFSAEIVSMPTDAMGIPNFDGTAPLYVDATIPDGQPTDRLGIYLTGPAIDQVGKLQTLYREVKLEDIPYDPVSMVATLTEAELDIVSSTSPVTARFDEGDLTIALQRIVGSQISPVRLLDVDMSTAGSQDALLDVERPTFVAFQDSGSESSIFHSDLRGLAVVGRASEELRSVEVTAGAMNNGLPLPPVIGSSSSGLFVAAPVDLGLVDPAAQPVAFTMELYDRALNQATAQVSGSFFQYGAIGPTALGPTIDVEVVNRYTLAPVANAAVFVHDASGAFVDVQVTSTTGQATVTAAAGTTVLTVDASGYDLFSFHGVSSSWVSVPLRRTAGAAGTLLGTVSSTNQSFNQFSSNVADSRAFLGNKPFIPITGCSPNLPTLSFDCSYGPGAIRPGAVRSVSFVAVDVPTSFAAYSAQGFLRGYYLQAPLPSALGGAQTFFNFRVDTMLDAPSVPAEEKALNGPAPTLSAGAVTGIDLANLAGTPLVAVQAEVRGMHGNALVGFGAALDPSGSPASSWQVASAIAGVADPTPGAGAGELVQDGIIDPNKMFLRCELRDTAGNRTGRRPPYASVPGTVSPPNVPLVTSPAPGGNTGGAGYDLVFANGLSGLSGLYRATLVGQNGRSWELYRTIGGGTSRTIRVVDLVASSGVGLPDGPVACTIEGWAWPGFDPTAFLFSDVDREHDQFAQSAPITFFQP